MDTMIRRTLTVLLGLAVVAALAVPAMAGKGKSDVHKPPYKKGHQGGDEWNHITADPKTGEVEVFRAFPGISPIVGCAPEPAAGWATLTQPHKASGNVDTVTLNFEGVVDPYGWVYAVVYDSHGDSIGLKKFQGPHAGAGKVKVKLFRQPKRGSEVTVEFGAQVGDSCPQASGVAVTFSSIKFN